MDTIGSRLKFARESQGLTPSELARRVEMSPQGVAQIENGTTKNPQPANLFRLAKACGVDPEWLATGRGAPNLKRGVVSYDSPDELPPDEFAMIPLLDVKVSAGAGVWTEDRAAEKYSLAFLRGWIQRSGYAPENLRLLEVSGDSMEPRVYDGDIVLIDISQTRPRNGRVYAIVYQDWVYLKKLVIRTDGAIEVISLNDKYPVEVIPPSDHERLRIVGRCVWAGGGGGL